MVSLLLRALVEEYMVVRGYSELRLPVLQLDPEYVKKGSFLEFVYNYPKMMPYWPTTKTLLSRSQVPRRVLSARLRQTSEDFRFRATGYEGAGKLPALPD